MGGDTNTFKILHAGALRKPMKEIIHILLEYHPGLNVELNYSGSRDCAKAVAQGMVVDVIVLADYRVFNDILVPTYVNTSFVFAVDQMVLAYDEFSPGSQEITMDNWMDILLQKHGIRYARSDENLDPCGYRTLMLWQLAEKYYQRPGLCSHLDKNLSNLYPKSIDAAVALMEGKIHYAFQYLSVAKQLNLKYIQFPPEVNLSDPRFADNYAQAKVFVEGPHPSIKQEITGAPIELAVAVPKNAVNKKLAQEFIDILTSTSGEKVLERNGLIPC